MKARPQTVFLATEDLRGMDGYANSKSGKDPGEYQGCASVRPTRRHGPAWHGMVQHGADMGPTRSGMAWAGLADGSERSGQ